MVILSVLRGTAIADQISPKLSLTPDERRQLLWLKATVVAERQLVGPQQPCADHHACRRLAFALWLSATGRVFENLDR
jgi:hypothetical protein